MESVDSKPGLDHKECLKILYDQIDQVLLEFKQNKFQLKQLIFSFFKQNCLEFIHNFIAIFLCSLSLFISFNERYTTNLYPCD